MLSTQEIDVSSRGALRSQVSPKEGLGTELVIRIVGGVLRHITIENGESRGVERIPSTKSRRTLPTRGPNSLAKETSPKVPLVLPDIARKCIGADQEPTNA